MREVGGKKKKNKNEYSPGEGKGRRPYHIILTVIYFIAMAVFSAMLVWLNFLPTAYLIGALAVILIGSVLIALFMNVKKPKSKRRVAGTIIALLLIVVYCIGMFYIYSTHDMFSKISNIGKSSEDFYVVTLASDDTRKAVDDIKGDDVFVFESDDASYAEAQTRLSELVAVNYEKAENYLKLAKKLKKGDAKVIFMSASYYDMACESMDGLEDKTKILYKVNVVSEVENIAKSVGKVTEESFNVFISGIDVFGTIDVVSRSDVNMVMTVNPKNRTILLTSIPRDSYVTLHSKMALDKLTHAGLYGVNESVQTLEDLLGTSINYYIRVNFSTVIDVVNAIDGIDVKSDVAFETHGRQNTGYSFVEGKNHLSGEEALAFARERYSFEDGDFQRNRNQQKVLKAMLKKVLSSKTILTKYTQLLDAVEDEMQTNMSTAEIQSLVKMQVEDMDSWNIITRSLSGDTGSAPCYAAGGAAASVVYLSEADVAKASSKIQGVMDGLPQADDEWTWEYDKKVKNKDSDKEKDSEEEK